MSNSIYMEMEQVLSNLAVVYTEIKDVLLAEREALITFTFDTLPDLNQKKEALCSRVHRLEAQREALFEDLNSISFHIQEKPLRLKSLIPAVPEHYRSSLEKLLKELDTTTDACVEVFRFNQRFIEHSLNNIQALRENYQQHLGATATTYSRAGRVESAAPTLVRKKV